ncbi:MAG: hypothetical protein MUO24_08815, partial [Desulfobacterales bacterium]|nr:hypothetical protein [Desulfobacterales bacterium]
GLASAIYYFTIPRWAQYLKITIRYKDAAQDDKIAGRLWIKSTGNDMRGKTGADEEALFYGDTFVLRSERLSETIMVPSNRNVENSTIEMHIVVDGNDCIDVRDIRVEYLDTQPQITIVDRPCDDYWDWWPRYRYSYHYYYWGPFFWPKTNVAYECWDVPTRFYWVTWRPWFSIFIKGFRAHAWWEPRRYTIIYHDDVKHPPIERRHLLHQRLKERHEQATTLTHSTPVIRETAHSPVQAHPSQNQEIRLKKEVKESPHIFETTANQNPTQRQRKEQPPRESEQRAKPVVNTQTKTIKNNQVVNQPDPRSAHPSDAAPQQMQHKDQWQARTAGSQQQASPLHRGAVQAPTPVHTPQNYGTKQEQQVQNPANSGQETMTQHRQEIQQPRSRGEEEGVQTRTAEPQLRSNPTSQEAVQTSAPARTARDDGTRQEQLAQSPANIGQAATPEPRQETQQPRSPGEERRPLMDHKQR